MNKTDRQQETARHSNLCFLEYGINNTQMFNDIMSTLVMRSLKDAD